MVGIVVVSHSAKVAEGVRELAEQMVEGNVPLALAGGVDDPENPIGTDAMKVHAAIESVYGPDGVLVLMDLGSALLSAETALEFLAPEKRANVTLCAAPLVEGALAAAVQASLGSDIAQVFREAQGALEAKIRHLESEEIAPEKETRELRLTLRNRMGLHARPAARFVSTAGRYQAEIQVHKGNNVASARSINQLATLGVRQGEEIVITATGPDAAVALAALEALVKNDFGEDSEPVRSAAPAGDELIGIPASPGIAFGPAVSYTPALPVVMSRNITDVAADWARLQQAIAAVQGELEALEMQTGRQAGTDIFSAHKLMLQDPALLEPAKALIFEHLNAEAAWQQSIEATAESYRVLDDEYLRNRAADVLDVGRRVLQRLSGIEAPPVALHEPSILIASELTPSETARLDPAKVLGICMESGGATSHSAILARALGIPAVAGLSGITRGVTEGEMIALDGSTGKVWLRPDEKVLAHLEILKERRQVGKTSRHPAVTQDGKRIEIAVNISGPQDLSPALEAGGEGVGLFRTEFLFMEHLPTEEEQYTVYKQVARALGKQPLTIRTLDVGGDKPLPYLGRGDEANPFLGWRGIRFSLDHPELLKAQLRAILRASPGHTIKLMFPMVGTLQEVRVAKEMLAEVRAELKAASMPFDEETEIGIMIEVPSAVAIADQLAAEVDFFSIGTNDLAQYVMAADRGNRNVAGLANSLHPAVLRLIRQTVEAAHAAGIRVGMCGELAGDVLATPVLVGLGLDALSMNARSVPLVKAAACRLTFESAQEVAREVLLLESAQAVEAYLESMTWS